MEVGSFTPVQTLPATAGGDVARIAIGEANKAEAGQVVPAVDRNPGKQKSDNSRNNDNRADRAKDQKAGSDQFRDAQNQRVQSREQRNEERLLRDQQQQIRQLENRDREVRAHERAHVAASGGLAGSPTYNYTRGPNGVAYATSGSVSIDSSKVAGDPEATLRKAERVKRAALAPADPSAQDRAVAAQATQLAIEARAEIVVEQQQERQQSESADETETLDETSSEPDAQSLTAQQDEEKTAQERAKERREEIQDRILANQRELQEKLSKAFALEQEFEAGGLLRVSV